MLRKSIVISGVVLVAGHGTCARLREDRGNWKLGGSGANGPNFNGFSAAIDGSLGFFLSDAFELRLIQNRRL